MPVGRLVKSGHLERSRPHPCQPNLSDLPPRERGLQLQLAEAPGLLEERSNPLVRYPAREVTPRRTGRAPETVQRNRRGAQRSWLRPVSPVPGGGRRRLGPLRWWVFLWDSCRSQAPLPASSMTYGRSEAECLGSDNRGAMRPSVYRDRFICPSPSGPDSNSSWLIFRGARQPQCRPFLTRSLWQRRNSWRHEH
jgi:hypothetical protein